MIFRAKLLLDFLVSNQAGQKYQARGAIDKNPTTLGSGIHFA